MKNGGKWPLNVFCFLRNIVDLLIDGETAWKNWFKVEFDGPTIPFGAECFYKPSYKEDQKRLHKYGSKMLASIFVGYAQHAGGGSGY